MYLRSLPIFLYSLQHSGSTVTRSPLRVRTSNEVRYVVASTFPVSVCDYASTGTYFLVHWFDNNIASKEHALRMYDVCMPEDHCQLRYLFCLWLEISRFSVFVGIKSFLIPSNLITSLIFADYRFHQGKMTCLINNGMTSGIISQGG
jgi:hypothetical protein